MDIKVLKVNAEGHYQEHDEAADTIKASSFKTANNELTDAKLTDLIGGGDASAQHDHASLYFGKTEHIDATTGVADAGLPIKSDSLGKIDSSFLPSLAHDDLDGVANSTAHLAFPLLVGGRDFTAVQKYDSAKTFTDALSLVSRDYVDLQVAALGTQAEWQQSVLSIESQPPAQQPAVGDRFLVSDSPEVGTDFETHANEIAEWDGTAFVFTVPSVGTYVSVDGISDGIYYFGGVSWVKKLFESTTASEGLKKVGLDIQADLKSAGGLKLDAGQIAIEASDIAGAGLLDDGTDKLAIDFAVDFANDHKALAADDLDASIVPFSSVNFTAVKVDTALEELYGQVAAGTFPKFTAAEALTKGDLVYISSNGSVSKYATLSNNDEVIGVALATVSASAQVAVALINTTLVGVLTGATAGTRYYWDGSALSTSMSVAAGANVWRVGVAKNATDLTVNVEHVKKNP